jgi:hypothetical protein
MKNPHIQDIATRVHSELDSSSNSLKSYRILLKWVDEKLQMAAKIESLEKEKNNTNQFVYLVTISVSMLFNKKLMLLQPISFTRLFTEYPTVNHIIKTVDFTCKPLIHLVNTDYTAKQEDLMSTLHEYESLLTLPDPRFIIEDENYFISPEIGMFTDKGASSGIPVSLMITRKRVNK